jgi:hypothetical protein
MDNGRKLAVGNKQTKKAESTSVLDKVCISPFDFNFTQIQKTRRVFEQAFEKKRTGIPGRPEPNNARLAAGIKMTEKATIEKLFQDLSRKIPSLS